MTNYPFTVGFAKQTKNTLQAKTVIPHFVSPNSVPVFPITKEYSRQILMVCKLWSNNFETSLEEKNAVVEYEKFLKSRYCPELVKIAISHVKDAYYNGNNTMHQPTAENNFPEVDPDNPNVDDRTRESCEGYGTLVSSL